jgi:transposase InsO family protein
VLDRTVEATAPNRNWIADFTYVRTAEGLDLCGDRHRPVLSARSRLVDAHRNDSATVTDALAMAIWRRGKPTDDSFIEFFNGEFRSECLNTHWFLSLDDARQKMEDWRRH